MTTASERLGTHRFEKEDAAEVLRQECPLLDRDLAPEAHRARQAIRMSLIGPVGRRACAAFLERDDYEKVQETYGDVLGCLMMEALVPFIRERGGQVAFTMLMADSDQVLNPIQHTVEIDGQTRHIVDCGYLFIHMPESFGLPEEKVVVSSECHDTHVGIQYGLTVRSSRDSAAFLRRWKDFGRRENYLRGRAFFADGEIIERSRRYTWGDILLPEDVKRAVRTHVEGFLRNRLRLKSLGVKGRRGLILEGPPGTGKTLLGKVLADTMDASFMWVSPRHVEGPRAFADILEVARFVAPTVLFLEDIDLFAEDRETGFKAGLLGELMNNLDGAIDNEDIITIATTNRLGVIEKALRNRPGRFDRILSLGAMDAPCRRGMLERLLAKAVVSADDVAHLVSVTDGYTGAQIEELANTLYILAVDGHNDASGNGDGKPSVAIDRPLIAAALEEFRVELKARVGFHAS